MNMGRLRILVKYECTYLNAHTYTGLYAVLHGRVVYKREVVQAVAQSSCLYKKMKYVSP